jgi:hypothetical protein
MTGWGDSETGDWRLSGMTAVADVGDRSASVLAYGLSLSPEVPGASEASGLASSAAGSGS